MKAYGRILGGYDYLYGQGPLADAVVAAARLRVDSSTPAGKSLQVCAIAYVLMESDPHTSCASYPVAAKTAVPVALALDTAGLRLDRVYLKLDDGGTIAATLDDAHLYVAQRPGTAGDGGGDPGGGDGGGSGGDGDPPADGDLEQSSFALHPTIRSALVQFDMALSSTAPVTVTVGIDRPRTESLASEVPVRDTYGSWTTAPTRRR